MREEDVARRPRAGAGDELITASPCLRDAYPYCGVNDIHLFQSLSANQLER